MKKSVIGLVAALLAIAPSSALGVDSASAATPGVANTDRFSVTRYVAYAQLGRCLKYKLTGELRYNAYRYRVGTGTTWNYDLLKPRIVAPKLQVNALQYDSVTHGCSGTSARWQKLRLVHAFKGYACAYNPKISISGTMTGFSVSSSVWPSCGDRKTGKRSSTYGSAGQKIQYNTGAVIGFAAQSVAGYKDGPSGSFKCYGAAVTGHLYVATGDDTLGTGRLKICPTPAFS